MASYNGDILEYGPQNQPRSLSRERERLSQKQQKPVNVVLRLKRRFFPGSVDDKRTQGVILAGDHDSDYDLDQERNMEGHQYQYGVQYTVPAVGVYGVGAEDGFHDKGKIAREDSPYTNTGNNEQPSIQGGVGVGSGADAITPYTNFATSMLTAGLPPLGNSGAPALPAKVEPALPQKEPLLPPQAPALPSKPHDRWMQLILSQEEERKRAEELQQEEEEEKSRFNRDMEGERCGTPIMEGQIHSQNGQVPVPVLGNLNGVWEGAGLGGGDTRFAHSQQHGQFQYQHNQPPHPPPHHQLGHWEYIPVVNTSLPAQPPPPLGLVPIQMYMGSNPHDQSLRQAKDQMPIDVSQLWPPVAPTPAGIYILPHHSHLHSTYPGTSPGAETKVAFVSGHTISAPPMNSTYTSNINSTFRDIPSQVQQQQQQKQINPAEFCHELPASTGFPVPHGTAGGVVLPGGGLVYIDGAGYFRRNGGGI